MNLPFSYTEFLKNRSEFSLGKLTTEKFHPLTKNLSQTINKDLNKALTVLKEVDAQALEKLTGYDLEIFKLQQSCQEVLSSGGRIFISGCGATGRLALSLEKISREMNLEGRVISFMAGGDFALIKSVESFEDKEDFGQRQLEELGFKSEDLLLGVTEGGETSFVIGTIEHAKKLSRHSPYFIYCNPDSELIEIERSRKLIEDERVKKLSLTVGPMAISGSTRMQATSVQMIACGVALFYHHESYKDFHAFFEKYCADFLNIDVVALEPFITQEYKLYKEDGIVTYEADPQVAIAVLTDTTERAPTFSLKSFEQTQEDELSLSYLAVKNCKNSYLAWKEVLGREPRALDWEELDQSVDLESLYQFDISSSCLKRRSKLKNHRTFKIRLMESSLAFHFDGEEHEFSLARNDLLFKHIALKLLLNIHSTAVMGLMGRYEGNMMTFVKASNFKLVDRSMRYVVELLKLENIVPDESEMAKYIYAHKDQSDSIVLDLKESYIDKS